VKEFIKSEIYGCDIVISNLNNNSIEINIISSEDDKNNSLDINIIETT